MKKIVFFLPVIIFTIAYGWLAITFGIGSISPIVFVWITLFLVSGFILTKYKFWGAFFGMLPGIQIICASTMDTGQAFSELPIGIVILIFYVLCSCFVFNRGNKIRTCA